MQDNPDGKLLERAKQGDKSAFEEFYSKYKKDIQGFIYRLTLDYNIAEELTQDAFINAYTHLDTYNEQGKPTAWLYTIAGNLAKNSLRARRRVNVSLDMPVQAEAEGLRLLDMLPDARADTSTIILNEELRKNIEDAVDVLPPKYKQAFTLCDMLGWSYRHAAETLHCKPNTIGSRLFRARARIAKKLRSVLFKD